MTQRILCRYFVHGVCRNGGSCPFSHDWSASQSTVCTFFLQGRCAYGEKCRYDHVRPDWSRGSEPSTSYTSPSLPKPVVDEPTDLPQLSNDKAEADTWGLPAYDPWDGEGVWEAPAASVAREQQPDCSGEQDEYANVSGCTIAFFDDDLFLEENARSRTHSAWQQQQGRRLFPKSQQPSDQMCQSYLRAGFCEKGDDCKQRHGLLCETCQRYALHPDDPLKAAEHQDLCRQRHQRLFALSASAHVECSICYEKVMSKGNPAERKFGLLLCEHPFCLSCIRSWRANSGGDMNVDTAVRTCPVCRLSSHLVIPSTVWPSSAEHKEEIVMGYKAKLATIDCKYFNFGDGTCPFGSSCLYRHAYRDGRLQEKTLRKAGTADGDVLILQPFLLSEFLETAQAQRVLRRGRR